MTYGNYPDLKLVKRILVVKMRHLGDVLLTSPIFPLLKKAMPWAEIDAYIYKESLPMLEGHPDISGYLLYDREWKKLYLFSKLAKEFAMLRKVRKGSYDLVINLTEGDRGAIIAKYSKCRYRIGFDPGKKGMKGKKNLYTHIIKNCEEPRHVVERHLDVLRCMGVFPMLDEREMSFSIPSSAEKECSEILASHNLEMDGYIVIHPVSRWLFKCPLPQFYVSLIEKLQSRGERIVITSGPSEKETAFVQAIMEKVDGVIDLSGKTSLKVLGSLIDKSKALITVDSVPLHMASALKAPVVTLFGPSSEIDWGPWQNPRSAVVAQKLSCRPCGMDGCGGSKLSDCLYTLSPDLVLKALDQISLTQATLV